MPLFNHVCNDCGNVFEALVHGELEESEPCRRCGGDSRRSEISTFRILGAGQRRQGGGLSAAELSSNADSFVSAMNNFGDRIGGRLSSRQMERAVENLRKARR